MGNILIHIKASSIYRDSLVEISFSSFEEFNIKFNNKIKILDIEIGYIKNNILYPHKQENKYYIKLITYKIFKEKVAFKKNNYILYYGMQLYPFISSQILLNFNIENGNFSNMIIELPKDYKFIWYKTFLKYGNNHYEIRISEEDDSNKYYFICKKYKKDIKQNNINNLLLKGNLRISGVKLEQIVNFPLYYYILVLFLTTIAANSNKINILLATIGGSWLFILRYWSKLNIPQQKSYVTYLYLLAAVIVPIWGLTYKLIGYYTFFFLPLILYIFWSIKKDLQLFLISGRLSSITLKIIGMIMFFNEQVRKNNKAFVVREIFKHIIKVKKDKKE